MIVAVVIGSRADDGYLAWPLHCLRQELDLTVRVLTLKGCEAWEAVMEAQQGWTAARPDWVLLLGDRYEVMGAAWAAHLLRIPMAHLCGGDVTRGSYDDAMRDCISRMATLHLVTSESAQQRLLAMGYAQVHLVGNPGYDYLLHGNWRGDRPIPFPYVVVSYQPETLDGTNEIEDVLDSLPDKLAVILMPNPDRGTDAIRGTITAYCARGTAMAVDALPHDEFLNLLAHCDEFIGNSSAMFYEAPFLGVPTRLIGTRQKGRVMPWGDGHASERIVKILKDQTVCVSSS